MAVQRLIIIAVQRLHDHHANTETDCHASAEVGDGEITEVGVYNSTEISGCGSTNTNGHECTETVDHGRTESDNRENNLHMDVHNVDNNHKKILPPNTPAQPNFACLTCRCYIISLSLNTVFYYYVQ